MHSLHVGIDVGLKDNTVVFTDETAMTRLARFTVPNDAGGAVRLVNEVADVMRRHKLSSLRIGMEATGVYAWHLAVFLSGSEVLRPFDAAVYLIQPRSLKNHRKSFGSRLSKTDGGDAWLLTEYLGHPRLLPRPFRMDERTIPL